MWRIVYWFNLIVPFSTTNSKNICCGEETRSSIFCLRGAFAIDLVLNFVWDSGHLCLPAFMLAFSTSIEGFYCLRACFFTTFLEGRARGPPTNVCSPVRASWSLAPPTSAATPISRGSCCGEDTRNFFFLWSWDNILLLF